MPSSLRPTSSPAVRAGLLGLLFSLPLAGGCWPGEPDWTLVARIDTLPWGTRVVENFATGAWAQGRPWGLREELRIGVPGGAGPDGFRDVAALLPDWEGNLFVLEWRSQEVRVFGGDGRHVRTFAGRGRAPGSLTGGAGMVWDPRGQLWVWDPVARRYSIFTREGAFVREEERAVLGVSYPWAGAVDWQWTLWDFGRLPTVYDREAAVYTEFWVPVRVPMEGEGSPESLPPVVLRRDLVGETLEGPLQGPFTAAVDPAGRLWFGDPRSYRIFKRTPAGDTLVVATLPHQPRRVSAQERDSVIQAFAAVGAVLEPERVPFHRPVLQRLVVDDDGHVFVFVDVQDGEVGRTVDVFDREGRYLGRLELPVRLDLSSRPVVRGDQLWGETRGPAGEPQIVRIRIRR